MIEDQFIKSVTIKNTLLDFISLSVITNKLRMLSQHNRRNLSFFSLHLQLVWLDTGIHVLTWVVPALRMPSFAFFSTAIIIAIAQLTEFTSAATTVVNATSKPIDDEEHNPYKSFCKLHNGEYYRDFSIKLVCCGNDSLTLPEILVHEQHINPVYTECSKKFSKDDTSDFPTGLWKAFLCKLEKSKVFKAKNKMTFQELLTFITQHYPDHVKKELNKQTVKCKGIDSEKLTDDLKIQKYMECYLAAENATCHKPYGEIENHDADNKKLKELGCPIIPGLVFSNSVEYCCKKRSTPYPVLGFPGTIFPEKKWDDIFACKQSFAKREKELKPEAFKVVTPKTEDGEDHQMHTTWDTLCFSACMVYQKNYTKDMLKLEPDRLIDFYTHDFGKVVREQLSSIVKRRKTKEKVFLAMDIDTEKSKPMDFAELTAKFSKASEKEKIQYFCKFVSTIEFEERRALHEYCFDEKYGKEWGDLHHSFFVPDHS